MGVRGLTTYINRNTDRYYQWHELRDCTVVIDGSSLACHLYIDMANCYSAFGGDYDRFSTAVRSFFRLLKRCNVTPIVITDGGYESRKLKTVFKRIRDSHHKVQRCTPANQNKQFIFPVMMLEVFKQTLKSIGIKFAQADFEADSQIAALGRYLDCPVISSDSDFYLYDVTYIPFTTITLSVYEEECDGHMKYYLSCQVYSVEHFTSTFGGLDKSLLPLLAVLLGNDYIPTYVAKKLYPVKSRNKKNGKKSMLARRVIVIFDWLKCQTLSSAITKILTRVKKPERPKIQSLIKSSMDEYLHCPNDLLDHLGLKTSGTVTSFADTEHLFNEVSQAVLSEESGDSEDSELEVLESSDDEESGGSVIEDGISSDEDMKDSKHAPQISSKFPPWLRDKFRRGELPPFVSDIFHLNIFICKSQMEDTKQSDSHTMIFPILKVLVRILFSSQCVVRQNDSITCHVRIPQTVRRKVKLEMAAQLPDSFSLDNIPIMPASLKMNLLYNTFGITDTKEMDLLESFGGRWQLFAIAVVFWARSSQKPKVTYCHLQALIISMIALGVVDRKIGPIRFRKKITSKCKSIHAIKQGHAAPENDPESNEDRSGTGIAADVSSVNLEKSVGALLKEVSREDCLNLSEFLLQCHQIDKRLLMFPKMFKKSIVHVYAQFQNCLNQAMALNSILEFPVPQCQVAETYSGTVAYMASCNFNSRRDIDLYIRSVMSKSLSLYEVYRALRDRFKVLLPKLKVLVKNDCQIKKKKEKKIVVRDYSDCAPTSDEEPVFDPNNKFSMLGMI